MNNTRISDVIRYEGKSLLTFKQELVEEEPLLIRVEGNPYSVVMRTPGEEIFHVAGFCLSEGLVDKPDDFATIGYCDQTGSNVANVTLRPTRRKKVSALLERRGFISQTSCGICGKEMIKDLCQILTPSTDMTRISIVQAIECVDKLAKYQDLYEKTRASHAVMLFDSQLEKLADAEDVGRHNALDKTIGKAFIGSQLEDALVAVLSSRTSYEMVQKAARANVPVLLGLSYPTALAVELGRSLNMTLACVSEEGGFSVFCGEERLLRE